MTWKQCSGIWWREAKDAKDAAGHPTVHRVTKKYVAQIVNSAEVKKTCLNEKQKLCSKSYKETVIQREECSA